jgi:hypothetical protein
MKRLVLLLGIAFLALFLVASCGKQEEPAKAQKPAASTTAPEKGAEKQAPATKAPEAKPSPAQPAPATPSPEKK